MENLNETEKKNNSGCEIKNEETQKSKMTLRTQKKIPNYFEKDLNLKLLNEKRTRTNFKSQKKKQKKNPNSIIRILFEEEESNEKISVNQNNFQSSTTKSTDQFLEKENLNSKKSKNFSNLSNSFREKFPNEIYKYEKSQREKLINEEENKEKKSRLKTDTFINCDLRYFNFDLLTKRIGFFDVVMLDPPWRIKGGQRNQGSFMFSNSRFSLNYDTLSNNDILSLKVENLSEKGFCFLWILNSILDFGYICLNKWGYEVIEQIIWIKGKNNNLFSSLGYYFKHSYEICLVGYKCKSGEHFDYYSKVCQNVIISEVNNKSEKPKEIYEMIEKMVPGSKKIELFARNNNLRDGWLSLGNQIGEDFLQWNNTINCNNCNFIIPVGNKVYKSRIKGNYDLCEKCFCDLLENKENYFELNNNVSDEIHHDFYSCNICNKEPIYGIRFSCLNCDGFDLCQNCFDTIIDEKSHFNNEHKFEAIEIPELASGFAIHYDCVCKYCFQKPIIGTCFECKKCKKYLCQNCYFNSEYKDNLHFGQDSDHRLIIRIMPETKFSKVVKCIGCEKYPIENIRYKCEYCTDFNLCEQCYHDRDTLKFKGANSHKPYHTFTHLMM